MRVLGIIPARGGSKRVPGKNIRLLAGKPLIAYTIEASLKSSLINRLMVSTDDIEIKKVAENYGAETPYLRPAELSQDDTPDQPVFVHALEWLKEKEDYQPDIVVCLRPTTPFKTGEIIDRVIRKMIDTNADIVRTMTRVDGVHHPYWMYRITENDKVIPFDDNIDISRYYRSQLLPPVYRINGVVDAYRRDVIYSGNILSHVNMKSIIISDVESIDIDTEYDFMICESIRGMAK